MKKDQGSILIVTLWVITLLGLMAWGVMESARLAVRRDAWSDGQASGRALLRSLGQLAFARLESDATEEYDAFTDTWGRPFELDSSVLQTDYQGAGMLLPAFRMSVLAVDESSKINVNLAPRELLAEVLRIAGYPAEAERIAEAILDWRDPDEVGAAESDYYASLVPAYAASNSDLKSIEELLFVSGVTPLVFFGEDHNRNGTLDAEENDGDLFLPYDDADGRLQPGLVNFFTVYGDGEININTVNPLVLQAVLQLFLNPIEAETRAGEIVGRRRGRDGLDGTEDDRPITTEDALRETLTEDLYQQARASGVFFSLHSVAQRFYVTVTLTETNQRFEGELLVVREDGELVPLEWREA